MFFRFLYLYWIFVYEFCYFYINNFFTRTLFGLPSIDRVLLVENITEKLENINIVYVKVFQSLCLEKGILTDIEKDYLMKYTDSVPYSNDEVDFDMLHTLEEKFGIVIENKTPINSGIVGVVFKGIHKKDNDKRVVVKMLKQGIVEKYNTAYNELELLVRYLQSVPYLNSINYIKMISDSKDSILSQTDFSNECHNIEYFNKKYENNKEFVLPEVYSSITEEYNNVIVMTDITGLRYNDIKDLDVSVKYKFAKLLNKFGVLSILFHSCINGDFHAGNVFFYIDNKRDASDNIVPEYKLGVIDYGLCYYPTPENQNSYYIFFYDIQTKKDFKKLSSILPTLIENKEYYYKFDYNKKNMFLEEVTDCIKTYSHKNFDINFFMNLSKIFKSYSLLFTKEFNNICMSLQVTNSLGLSLYSNVHEVHTEIMNEIVQIDRLIEIED